MLNLPIRSPAGKEATVQAYNVAVTDTLKSFPTMNFSCLLYTSPSPRDGLLSRMPSSA